MRDRRLNIIGPQVKHLRLSKKPPMTQDQLSVQLQLLDWKIDRFGISKIERGERQITDQELLKLAQAFGVSVSILIGEY